MYRIVFMGTPDFAVPALAALLASPHKVVAVYSQPPRPKGRGHAVQASPVQQLAEQNNIPVLTPTKLRSAEAQAEFSAHNADIAIVAAYGLLLPQAILDTPKYGCINLHASLLPRWRGASPIQHAIWYGDAETGVTLMQMDAGLDTGAMLRVVKTPITPTTTSASLQSTLAELGGADLLKLLGDLPNLKPTPQPDAGTTHARLLTKQDGVIDWTKTAAEIDRQIRAFTPWPPCRSGTIKILTATPSNQLASQTCGTVLDAEGHVVCGGSTVLQIKTLQPDNAKPMNMADAIRGGYITIGSVLGA